MKDKLILILSVCLFVCSCTEINKKGILEKKVESYFVAWNKQDFTNPTFSEFKRDTSYTWHGVKKGNGVESIFNPNSGWKQWDKAWNGSYIYNILEIDIDSLKVVGEFRETTDFLKIIGMPEGFSAKVTFWFDDSYKVKETLYAWSSDNRKTSDVLKPIVEWAKVNDSIRIDMLYLKNGLIPNTENAESWKSLLDAYMIATGNKR